jgi:hypothetical protein
MNYNILMPSQTIVVMEDLKNWENNNYKLHVAIIKNLTSDCIAHFVMYLIFDDIPKKKGV